jgi:hypothetical protein
MENVNVTLVPFHMSGSQPQLFAVKGP